ncbi:MAG: hypothetical protein FWD06_04990 [Oscillospiraceae bacterium]|nr:hypothetical protein [Oscillospiraceae bacterium]
MSEKFKEDLRELDRLAEEAGGYLAVRSREELDNEPHYNYPALSRYAREKGVKPYQLSESEIEHFRVAA